MIQVVKYIGRNNAVDYDLNFSVGLYVGDWCKLPKHIDKGEKHKNVMQVLEGVKTRSKAGKFEPVRTLHSNVAYDHNFIYFR